MDLRVFTEYSRDTWDEHTVVSYQVLDSGALKLNLGDQAGPDMVIYSPSGWVYVSITGKEKPSGAASL